MYTRNRIFRGKKLNSTRLSVTPPGIDDTVLTRIQTLVELGAVNAAEVLEMWEKVGIPASARNEMEKVKSYFKEYFKENEDTSKYIKGLAF